jgi:23S rRNA (adenine2030-N6)-methyltransferase
MNYRHAYHVGNFADVVKHIIVTRIIDYLKNKDKAFRVIDTHAGIGFYDLASIEAKKTAEWKNGVGKIDTAQMPDDVHNLIAPWLSVVR